MKRMLLVGKANSRMIVMHGEDGSIAGKSFPVKKEISHPVEQQAIENITKDSAFGYIKSIKHYLNIEDDSFIINYEYKGADIDMVVIDGNVYYLEINPILKACNISEYSHLPIYTQIKGMA